MKHLLPLIFVIPFCAKQVAAQFTPIPVSGFSQDVIAEGGPSPLATTTMEIDALTPSNKVMYKIGRAHV